MNDISYKNWYSMSDTALCKLIGNFIKHHRQKKELTQANVAKKAAISRSTLSLLERGETVTIATLLQVLRTLELLHVLDTFTVRQEISPIALAKLQQNKRQRVRPKKKNDNQPPKSDW